MLCANCYKLVGCLSHRMHKVQLLASVFCIESLVCVFTSVQHRPIACVSGLLVWDASSQDLPNINASCGKRVCCCVGSCSTAGRAAHSTCCHPLVLCCSACAPYSFNCLMSSGLIVYSTAKCSVVLTCMPCLVSTRLLLDVNIDNVVSKRCTCLFTVL